MRRLAEVGRAPRLPNVALGVWVLANPWFLGGATLASRWSAAIAAALVILLRLPREPVGERFGTKARFIR